MTTPTKRSAKAKKLWAYPYEDGDVVTDVPPSKHDVKRGFCRPVFLLPGAPEDVERMKKAVAKSIYFKTSAGVTWSDPAGAMHRRHCLFMAGDALRTLGLTPAKKTKALP